MKLIIIMISLWEIFFHVRFFANSGSITSYLISNISDGDFRCLRFEEALFLFFIFAPLATLALAAFLYSLVRLIYSILSFKRKKPTSNGESNP